MITISRQKMLRRLKLVSCALAKRETVIQSKCFCFCDGLVMCYNDAITSQIKSGLPRAWVGAVEAQPLLDYLRKVPAAVMDVDIQGKQLITRWKDTADSRKAAYFNMEPEVNLPVDQVEKPGEWLPLPYNFGRAVTEVQQCALDCHDTFCRTVVCLTPSYVMAYDGRQMMRYDVSLPIDCDYVLVRKEAIKHIPFLKVTHFSLTNNWVHFCNRSGLMVSCRRWLEDYPLEDLDELSTAKGYPLYISKSLIERIELIKAVTRRSQLLPTLRVQVRSERGLGVLCLSTRAYSTKKVRGWVKPKYKRMSKGDIKTTIKQLFVDERGESAAVGRIQHRHSASLRKLMRKRHRSEKQFEQVEGSHSYTQTSVVSYKGPPLTFEISPSLLATIVSKHQAVELTKGILLIARSVDWTYVAGTYPSN